MQENEFSIDDKTLREMFHTLDHGEWRKVSEKRELAWWRKTNRYCGQCGAELVAAENPSERAMCCPRCGFRSYPKIMPAVITVITRRLPGREEEVLLQRNTHYGLPYWTLVAGFVDPGETFEEAVRREAREESGVEVGAVRYFGSQIWPFPSNMMVAYRAEWVSGELRPDGDEVVESGWFDRGHLPPLPRTGSIARRMIDAWIAEAKPVPPPRQTTLCYIERGHEYLILHRTKKEHDENGGKWIGVGGKFELGESPEECLLREVREETGLELTKYRRRGLVTFVSDEWGTEYMHLFTATEWRGELSDCDEGELVWLDKDELLTKRMWEGDRIFLKALGERDDYFSLKLQYRGERLVSAKFE